MIPRHAATELRVLKKFNMSAAIARVLTLRQLIDLHMDKKKRLLGFYFNGPGQL